LELIVGKFTKIVFVTGGAGFIGSHLVRRFLNRYPEYLIVNLDALTYSGNLENLADIANAPNYLFRKIDICDQPSLNALFTEFSPDYIIHLAAESHVDRSILDPMTFVKTNVLGTGNLLQSARENWKDNFSNKRFYHVSTDEVYGSLSDEGFFVETTPYDPRSPYSASKAGSDMLARSFYHTFGLPIVISNCSNNYGPNQFPEKLIPLFISNIVEGKPLPVYGKGENIRDWLYVEDHAVAIDLILHEGKVGDTYNIGGENEWTNIDLIKLLCQTVDRAIDSASEEGSDSLITYIKDRAGHDFRYAIDCSKLKNELGWKPTETFESGLEKTVNWYISNPEWIAHVKSGAYQDYYKTQYTSR
jgi:dTDP-glucose 4,6-dehydratase